MIIKVYAVGTQYVPQVAEWAFKVTIQTCYCHLVVRIRHVERRPIDAHGIEIKMSIFL